MSDDPQLVVDEGLFLQARRTLAGHSETELLHVVPVYSREPVLAYRFSEAVGREIGEEERQAIDYYVSAVYLVSDHNANLDQLGEALGGFDAPALDFIRLAAWAFLTACTVPMAGAPKARSGRAVFL